MATLVLIYIALTLAFVAGVRIVERSVDSRWIGVPLLGVSLGYFLLVFFATDLLRGVLQ